MRFRLNRSHDADAIVKPAAPAAQLSFSASSPPDLTRRAARRRVVGFTFLALLTASSVAAGFAVAQQVTGPDDGSVSDGRAPSQGDDDGGAPTPTTAKYEITSGQVGKVPWSIYAYRGVSRGREAEQAGISGAESLCLSSSFGPRRGPLATCFVGLQEPFEQGTYVTVHMALPPTGEHQTLVYGTVAPEVARIEARMGDRTFEARISKAPPGLGLTYDFFYAIVPGYEDGSIVALTEAGELLTNRPLEQPALLTVTKSGDGSGTVYGYASEELRCTSCGAPEARWIDCGGVCRAGLEGARITLVAEPDEGSVFVGWGGACSNYICELEVTEETRVTATFSRVP